MRTPIDPSYDSIVSDIRLRLCHPMAVGKVWLLVEGKTDSRVYQKMFSDNVVIIPTSGIYTLLAVLDTIEKETNQVIAIRDADFFHLENEQEKLPDHLFMTDCHDIEMMMIACDEAFCSVLTTHTGMSRKDAIAMRRTILSSIAFLGGIRWINSVFGLKLYLEKLPVSSNSFYDGKTMTLDDEKCVSLVNIRSKDKTREINTREIHQKIAGISDLYNLCQGHDAMRALADNVTFLRHGLQEGPVHHDRDIAKGFIQAYRFSDFQQTRLFRNLLAWTKKYRQYYIFCQK